jgi:hypothetical protein
MAAQNFTKNYRDHSNDHGFQFEFQCDKCGNGHRSEFHTSKVGVAVSLARMAGSLFGGRLSNVGYSANHLKDMLRGPVWDSAFGKAIEECKPKFNQCSRCGNWVCPEICWNHARGLCEACAPDLKESAASIQAHVAMDQLQERARGTDQTGGLDVGQPLSAAQQCAHCQSPLAAGARFCGSCGKPAPAAASGPRFCSGCGNTLAANARFCGNCGTSASP